MSLCFRGRCPRRCKQRLPRSIFKEKKGESSGICVERVFRITDLGEIEPFRRRDGAAGGAVLGGKGSGDIVWRPGAGTDAFQCTNKAADLIVQEGTCAEAEVDFGAGDAVDMRDVEYVQRFNWAGGLADGGPKGRKVMVADQSVGG